MIIIIFTKYCALIIKMTTIYFVMVVALNYFYTHYKNKLHVFFFSVLFTPYNIQKIKQTLNLLPNSIDTLTTSFKVCSWMEKFYSVVETFK